MRYKYPADLDPLEVKSRFGPVAIRKWLGMAKVELTDAQAAALARFVRVGDLLADNLVPKKIGTMLLNDLYRLQTFVSGASETVRQSLSTQHTNIAICVCDCVFMMGSLFR